jgi:hypothetical protein
MATALALEHEGLGELEAELESELEFEADEMTRGVTASRSWQQAVRAADRAILNGSADDSDLLSEHGLESELESEFEGEMAGFGEISPVSKVYPDAMMEHLAHAAMEAESEHEAAEGFLPLIPLIASKLLPLAAKALPKLAGRALPQVARAIHRVTPQLTRSVGNLARTLHRNPQTRPLLRVVPSIARRAVTTIARQAAAGRPITPQSAVRVLARQNHRVLSNPRIVGRVLRQSRQMDGRYHRVSGLPAVIKRNGVSRPGATAVAAPGGVGPRVARAGLAAGRFCPHCGTRTIVTRAGHPQGCSTIVVVR